MRKLLIACLLLAGATCLGQNVCDVLIKNGRIIDGTSNSWFYSDVTVTQPELAT